MSEASEKPRPFDVRTIEFLVRLMRENDISELDLAEGDERIRLRRGPRLVAGVAATPPVAVSHPSSAPTPQQAAPVPAATQKPAKNLPEIRSPTVGVFYAQKEPGTPPFVKVGDRVNPKTVVGLIMAMKVFSEIEAGCSGTIAEICAKNEDPVEYGTVLFRVEP